MQLQTKQNPSGNYKEKKLFRSLFKRRPFQHFFVVSQHFVTSFDEPDKTIIKAGTGTLTEKLK